MKYLFFESIKNNIISNAEEALNKPVIQDVPHGDQVIQEELKDFHSLFNMSLGSFSCLFLRNGRNHMWGVGLGQVRPQPYKITVSPTHFPIEFKCLNFEFKETGATDTKEASSIFSLRAV